ncbi:hypothetical protein GCM10022384_70400 [Streptomyces marokkonensis]|uniref:Uncharacterized protein n=1 Tax=Streptomyces marokkonensis TaxID=324855 RepID=A0ABP7SXS5_9ACTN
MPAGLSGMDSLLDAWGRVHRIGGPAAHVHAEGEAEQSFITGREDAYPALRARK